MKSWFKNKSIAVVGNAKSLFNFKYGKDIDAHDVVCRINLGVMSNNIISHGTKTDVLIISKYAFYNLSIRQYYKYNVGLKIPHIMLISKKTRSFDEIVQYPKDNINNLHQKLGLYKNQNLTSGILLLDYLDRCNTSSVDVYGFDWKKTATFYNENLETQDHNYEAERLFCMKYFCVKRGFRFF